MSQEDWKLQLSLPRNEHPDAYRTQSWFHFANGIHTWILSHIKGRSLFLLANGETEKNRGTCADFLKVSDVTAKANKESKSFESKYTILPSFFKTLLERDYMPTD